MRKYIKYFFFLFVLLGVFILSCNKKDPNAPNSDTILEGKTTILVDETLLPIVEDQLAVFENSYKAKITLLPQSEKECILSLTQSKADVVILSRELTKEETNFFQQKKIKPRNTAFAIDAIAFIKNKKANDTLIALQDVIDFMKGSKNSIKGLVFDNPNSSTTRYLCDLAGVSELPQQGVFSFKTNEDVINYIADNEGMIGIVGLNWLYQPKPTMQSNINKLNVMSVKNLNDKNYVYPTQDNVANRKYPLARVLQVVNCQGYEGLGMGFSSFVAGEKGQRIVLTSGLAPVREPGHNLKIRNTIEKK